ncbi:GTP 3',8-cyclase MoaA [Rhodopirellula sp. MGV]|uniref:GTP 3',8-cyclase MoaA n=1 Tax=Rhodopirellula sp. MGV TaxID=2023130 RepID=UPI000B9784E0|nr:GTP 3',8-cyclase MoaA [Rhodopirellula sp. MGV]OYP38304.1 GTP 3',8-cyclase MoaA [Rhodopirellula sp. MGV]PNY38893.1 GTP 3',8-cyclase MoaA [Rhodopirellula baltica]
MGQQIKLIDRFRRLHRSLRLSVTDRCNLRCSYCMPAEGAIFVPRPTLLTFEEITRVVRLLSNRCGITDVRLTGGEPLVRRELPKLVAMLADLGTLTDLSLTSNAMLLEPMAAELRQAGLRRINISIDTLDEATFRRLTRRDGLDKVLRGIDAAINAGFENIKLNATAIRGITESEVIDLVQFAIEKGVQIRFIEFMPLDADRNWTNDGVLTGDDIRQRIESHFGALIPHRTSTSQPATDYLIDGKLAFGLIESVTKPFCNACDRIRMTADGSIRNCLFSQQEYPLRDLLRDGASDDAIVRQFIAAVNAKESGHGIGETNFAPPDRPMYSIGG